jgi:hypothetical protein
VKFNLVLDEQTVIGGINITNYIYPFRIKVSMLAFEARGSGALPLKGAITRRIRIIEVLRSLKATEMGQNHHPLPYRDVGEEAPRLFWGQDITATSSVVISTI